MSKDLEQENEKLKQQLAEKEKELAWYVHFYQESIKDNKKLYENNLSVRHEICEKIMFILGKEYFKYCSVVSYDFIKRVLERVEKGEE